MAELEFKNLGEIVKQALKLTSEYLKTKEHNRELFDEVAKLEQISDNVQKEMTTFICNVMENSLSNEQSAMAYALIRAADELESMLDYCQAACRYRQRLYNNNQDFSESGWADIYDL